MQKKERVGKSPFKMPPEAAFLLHFSEVFNYQQAKFDLFCFQSFGNRFGDAKGAAPFKLFAPFLHLFLHLSKKPKALFHRS